MMNEKQVNPIEIDRQKSRILNGLEAAFHHVTVKEGQALISEAVAEIEDYEKKVYGVEQPTVKSVVQDMYQLSDDRFSPDIGLEVLQAMFFADVEQLAELLGIDLEG